MLVVYKETQHPLKSGRVESIQQQKTQIEVNFFVILLYRVNCSKSSLEICEQPWSFLGCRTWNNRVVV